MMGIVRAGGHAQIALRLSRLLHARGDEPVGLIRSAEHAADLRAAGAEPVLLNLENASGAAEVSEALKGAGAVVFAAGAGPGRSAERQDTVDPPAALLLAD